MLNMKRNEKLDTLILDIPSVLSKREEDAGSNRKFQTFQPVPAHQNLIAVYRIQRIKFRKVTHSII